MGLACACCGFRVVVADDTSQDFRIKNVNVFGEVCMQEIFEQKAPEWRIKWKRRWTPDLYGGYTRRPCTAGALINIIEGLHRVYMVLQQNYSRNLGQG